MRQAFVGNIIPKMEDGGQAVICEIHGTHNDNLFVRLQSWDEDRRHEQLKPFVGKKVMIIVEVLDDVQIVPGKNAYSLETDYKAIDAFYAVASRL